MEFKFNGFLPTYSYCCFAGGHVDLSRDITSAKLLRPRLNLLRKTKTPSSQNFRLIIDKKL